MGCWVCQIACDYELCVSFLKVLNEARNEKNARQITWDSEKSSFNKLFWQIYMYIRYLKVNRQQETEKQSCLANSLTSGIR